MRTHERQHIHVGLNINKWLRDNGVCQLLTHTHTPSHFTLSLLCDLCTHSRSSGVRLPHRSMVACWMGVEADPPLTAVNGPVFRDWIKSSTGTLELRGLLWTDKNQFKNWFCSVTQSCTLGVLEGGELTMCIPAFCTSSPRAAGSSRRCTRSSSPSRGCRPAAHGDPT